MENYYLSYSNYEIWRIFSNQCRSNFGPCARVPRSNWRPFISAFITYYVQWIVGWLIKQLQKLSTKLTFDWKFLSVWIRRVTSSSVQVSKLISKALPTSHLHAFWQCFDVYLDVPFLDVSPSRCCSFSLQKTVLFSCEITYVDCPQLNIYKMIVSHLCT